MNFENFYFNMKIIKRTFKGLYVDLIKSRFNILILKTKFIQISCSINDSEKIKKQKKFKIYSGLFWIFLVVIISFEFLLISCIGRTGIWVYILFLWPTMFDQNWWKIKKVVTSPSSLIFIWRSYEPRSFCFFWRFLH